MICINGIERSVYEWNTIIAKFMKRSYQFAYDLTYHTSWESLHQVVDNIEITPVKGEFIRVTIDTKFCRIWTDLENPIEYINTGNKRECVYMAVLEYMDWYNLNK